MADKVRKAVITAAGRGTRMYPATTTIQKEMLPLMDVDGLCRPVIQIIIEEALANADAFATMAEKAKAIGDYLSVPTAWRAPHDIEKEGHIRWRVISRASIALVRAKPPSDG